MAEKIKDCGKISQVFGVNQKDHLNNLIL